MKAGLSNQDKYPLVTWRPPAAGCCTRRLPVKYKVSEMKAVDVYGVDEKVYEDISELSASALWSVVAAPQHGHMRLRFRPNTVRSKHVCSWQHVAFANCKR